MVVLTNKNTQKMGTEKKSKFTLHVWTIWLLIYDIEKGFIPVMKLPWTAQCYWLRRLLIPNFDPSHGQGQQEPAIFKIFGSLAQTVVERREVTNSNTQEPDPRSLTIHHQKTSAKSIKYFSKQHRK